MIDSLKDYLFFLGEAWIAGAVIALFLTALGKKNNFRVSETLPFRLSFKFLILALLFSPIVLFFPELTMEKNWKIAFLIFILVFIFIPDSLLIRIFPDFIACFITDFKPCENEKDTAHGTANWGNFQTALNSGKITPAEPSFALGRLSENPPELDCRFRHMGHIVTCAPTGAGKGIGAVIPNLLEYIGSCFVLDLKGENFAVTARQRKAMGHQVYCIDPFNVSGTGGNSFNILGIKDCLKKILITNN